ncbi:MAG: phospholipase D-like domain-containing protein [Candidatus Borkfalkiaceae bacterium]|nr:phospholipase D-like domain-containing protein [Clostridia bacterium]MDY6222899.1 phospholipase D-like domain-containing protein [Christensenellaceae bacterium]
MKRMSERRRKRTEKILYRNRKAKVIIYNRIFLTALAMLLQIALFAGALILLYSGNSYFATLLLFATNLAGFAMILHILNRNDRPSDKLNWIIVILVLPVFGVPMFFLYGDGRPTKKMNRKIITQRKNNVALLPPPPALSDKAAADGANADPAAAAERYEKCDESNGISKYLTDFASSPASFDGEVTYFSSGRQTFNAIMEAVRGAKKFILAEYFIISPGNTWSTFLQALVEKANEGVAVRLIFDNAGCLKSLPPKYDKYVESLHPNIKCFTFNPISPVFTVRINNRDHRKQIIVDGETAFTGGINLADEYVGDIIRFGDWKDSGLKLTGSAVNTFTMMFFNIWNAFREDKDDVSAFYNHSYTALQTERRLQKANAAPEQAAAFMQPYDDSPLDKENVSATVYLDIINRARRYLWIYTPYLVPDDRMRTALCSAAKRGVDVRIVVPGIPDKKLTYRLTKANFPPLLKSGVKIYVYTPGFIHAKSMLSDDRFAVVGTINLDYRSLYLNFENAVYFSDCTVADELKKDCLFTFPQCREVTEKDLKKGWIGSLVDSLLRVFETLF